jgi:hypothetical protein
MNILPDQLAKSLLQKDTLQECTIQELRQMAGQYPYFSAAHFLLAKKSVPDIPLFYKEQFQKISLFFHNPLWLHQLLNDTGNAEIIAAEKLQEEKKEPAFPDTIKAGSFVSPGQEQPVITEEVVADTVVLSAPEEQIIAMETPGLQTESFVLPEQEQPVITEEVIAEHVILSEPEEQIIAMESHGLQTGSFILPEQEQPVITEEVIIDPVILSEPEEQVIAMEAPGLQTGSFVLPEQEQPVITEQVITDPVILPEPGQPAIAMEMPELKAVIIEPAHTELTFEPYHTVDYFASLGIKFREDEKPKDKFGQQLKSFTEWLKTLKRLPAETITVTNEGSLGQKVEQLAEHSLQDREVITETMAEVWEKQGNAAKAIEIYNKLSLLDPLKRPYFATKIEALKKIN